MSSVASAFIMIILLPASLSHMSMQYPYPRDNNGAYAKWQANEPMIAAHPMICHGLSADNTVRQGNIFEVGDIITIDIYGSASHNGGHCSFWYSTDDITFTKIIDIKDCTLNPTGTTVTLPKTMPTQCATKCTFVFTWVPRFSGACEIYMNCADIQVLGALGGNSNPITMNFETSFIDESNNGYGCSRVDDTTHWTSIFSSLKTDYDETDTKPKLPNGIRISEANLNDTLQIDTKGNDIHIISVPDIDPSDVSGTCYAFESLAINLKNNIDNMGRCGTGHDAYAYRCDDGMCCSRDGYCGPEYDGTGWINYDTNGYYENTNDAYAAYCTNAIGDWRIVTCAGDVDNAGDIELQSNVYMLSVFVSNWVLVSVFLVFYT